jgi:SAM-dependent methyltransferase
VSLPLAKAGVELVGIDRSAAMLDRLRSRVGLEGLGKARGTLALARGDIRALPFAPRAFAMVIAPYGILQSLLRDRDLASTLDSVARVLRRGGVFGIDLVPDVPHWREYRNRVQLRGRASGGAHLTLIESVRQDPRRHLTTFEQRYVERRGDRVAEHRFELTFRTLSVRQMTNRLERAGFSMEAVLGDYRGRPWDERADVWIMMARRR